ncbi:hypothetical protein ACFCZ3_20100 [Cellulosimicrobium cellulans]|uniref:hypothetical protein n=1 Tax=Cellulosimicrobium cellulans TaxID=1710 RepID=UPI0035DBEBCF
MPTTTAPTVTVAPDDVVAALNAVVPPSATVTTVPTPGGLSAVVSHPDAVDVTVTVGATVVRCGMPLAPVTVKRGPLTASSLTDPADVPAVAAGAYARLTGAPTCGWCGRALPHGSTARHCDRSHAAAAQNAARARQGHRSRWE